jgi:hypothetical protein
MFHPFGAQLTNRAKHRWAFLGAFLSALCASVVGLYPIRRALPALKGRNNIAQAESLGLRQSQGHEP